MDVWRAAAGRAKPLQSFLVLFPAFSFRSEQKVNSLALFTWRQTPARDCRSSHILNHSLIVVGACRVVGVSVPGAQQSRDTTQHAAAAKQATASLLPNSLGKLDDLRRGAAAAGVGCDGLRRCHSAADGHNGPLDCNSVTLSQWARVQGHAARLVQGPWRE
jgi:hypothetical protein